MLVIFGYTSQISQAVRYHEIDEFQAARLDDYPVNQLRYLFCCGYLSGKKMEEMSLLEFRSTLELNFTGIVRACDRILEANPRARICVIGSESGISGSYDTWYAACKKSMHEYIERKKLSPAQQLVGIAPGIIADAGMTLRRKDQSRLEARCRDHPKQRFLQAVEVGQLVNFLLYTDQGYITNTVVRMNGGEHTK